MPFRSRLLLPLLILGLTILTAGPTMAAYNGTSSVSSTTTGGALGSGARAGGLGVAHRGVGHSGPGARGYGLAIGAGAPQPPPNPNANANTGNKRSGKGIPKGVPQTGFGGTAPAAGTRPVVVGVAGSPSNPTLRVGGKSVPAILPATGGARLVSSRHPVVWVLGILLLCLGALVRLLPGDGVRPATTW